jgi:hypothetical protein
MNCKERVKNGKIKREVDEGMISRKSKENEWKGYK